MIEINELIAKLEAIRDTNKEATNIMVFGNRDGELMFMVKDENSGYWQAPTSRYV